MPEKWTFLSLAFYNAPSLHAVKTTLKKCLAKLFWISEFLALSMSCKDKVSFNNSSKTTNCMAQGEARRLSDREIHISDDLSWFSSLSSALGPLQLHKIAGLRQNIPGESNMRHIMVAVLCRLRPPLPKGEAALLRYRTTPLLRWEVLWFFRISSMKNGCHQIGACLILSEMLAKHKVLQPAPWFYRINKCMLSNIYYSIWLPE